MKNYSLTQSGNLGAIIGVVMLILNHYQVNIAEAEVTALIAGVLSVLGILTSWLGRYRKGDLTVGGFRK